jgi:endonuclease YncB( thermonuclease family)
MYEYKIQEILRVVDGDTIDVTVDLGFSVLKKLRIRLSSIDCPETKNMKGYENTCLKKVGDDAADFVARTLSFEKDYIYVSKSFEGKYGRSIGDIKFKDGRFLTEILITEQLAVPYTQDIPTRMEMMMKLHEYHKHAYED